MAGKERQRTGAVQDAGAQTGPHCSRSVLDCASPLALFAAHAPESITVSRCAQNGIALKGLTGYTGIVASPLKTVRSALRRRACHTRRPLCQRAAFSLIEMLIVLALMLIMIVMLYGFSSRSRQERDKAACRKNLQKCYIALEIYANEHEGKFPFVAGAKSSEEPLSLLVPKCTVATDSFVCPGGKDSALPDGEPFAKRTISYAYYMGLRADDADAPLMSDRQVNTGLKQTGDLLFSSSGDAPGNNHHKYGGNVLSVGGEIETSKARAEFSLAPTQQVVLLNPKP